MQNLDGSWEIFAGAGEGRYAATISDGVIGLKKALEMQGILGTRLAFRPGWVRD